MVTAAAAGQEAQAAEGGQVDESGLVEEQDSKLLAAQLPGREWAVSAVVASLTLGRVVQEAAGFL